VLVLLLWLVLLVLMLVVLLVRYLAQFLVQFLVVLPRLVLVALVGCLLQPSLPVLAVTPQDCLQQWHLAPWLAQCRDFSMHLRWNLGPEEQPEHPARMSSKHLSKRLGQVPNPSNQTPGDQERKEDYQQQHMPLVCRGLET